MDRDRDEVKILKNLPYIVLYPVDTGVISIVRGGENGKRRNHNTGQRH